MTTKPKLVPSTAQERKHFAARLRRWRADRRLLLKQVASEFGVAEATWSRQTR